MSATVDAAIVLHGTNRKDVALALGHAPSWMTLKMTGARRWSLDDVDALAEHFGMPFGAFFIERARAGAAGTRKYLARVGARYLHVSRGLGVPA